jgi:hypothetical protein
MKYLWKTLVPFFIFGYTDPLKNPLTMKDKWAFQCHPYRGLQTFLKQEGGITIRFTISCWGFAILIDHKAYFTYILNEVFSCTSYTVTEILCHTD